MIEAKDLIKEHNVIKAYQEGKYICFDIFTKKNDFGTVWKVKMNPNEVPMRADGAKIGG